MKPLAQVLNAADREQVKRAGRKERDREERRLSIYASVLNTVDGRALVWDLLASSGIFTSPFHASGSTVYYNIGRSDFGRELLAYLVTEHQAAYLLMEREARLIEMREQNEIAAAHSLRDNEREQ